MLDIIVTLDIFLTLDFDGSVNVSLSESGSEEDVFVVDNSSFILSFTPLYLKLKTT